MTREWVWFQAETTYPELVYCPQLGEWTLHYQWCLCILIKQEPNVVSHSRTECCCLL